MNYQGTWRALVLVNFLLAAAWVLTNGFGTGLAIGP